MQLIHDKLPQWNEALPRISVPVERRSLATRRYRAVAQDGADFGFDLEYPLKSGDVFHETSSAVYRLEQKPEPVLEFALGETTTGAARLGWLFGNLHFPMQITERCVRVADDPAVLQVSEREHLRFTASVQVFTPLSGSAGHGHGHHHLGGPLAAVSAANGRPAFPDWRLRPLAGRGGNGAPWRAARRGVSTRLFAAAHITNAARAGAALSALRDER